MNPLKPLLLLFIFPVILNSKPLDKAHTSHNTRLYWDKINKNNALSSPLILSKVISELFNEKGSLIAVAGHPMRNMNSGGLKHTPVKSRIKRTNPRPVETNRDKIRGNRIAETSAWYKQDSLLINISQRISKQAEGIRSSKAIKTNNDTSTPISIPTSAIIKKVKRRRSRAAPSATPLSVSLSSPSLSSTKAKPPLIKKELSDSTLSQAEGDIRGDYRDGIGESSSRSFGPANKSQSQKFRPSQPVFSQADVNNGDGVIANVAKVPGSSYSGNYYGNFYDGTGQQGSHYLMGNSVQSPLAGGNPVGNFYGQSYVNSPYNSGYRVSQDYDKTSVASSNTRAAEYGGSGSGNGAVFGSGGGGAVSGSGGGGAVSGSGGGGAVSGSTQYHPERLDSGLGTDSIGSGSARTSYKSHGKSADTFLSYYSNSDTGNDNRQGTSVSINTIKTPAVHQSLINTNDEIVNEKSYNKNLGEGRAKDSRARNRNRVLRNKKIKNRGKEGSAGQTLEGTTPLPPPTSGNIHTSNVYAYVPETGSMPGINRGEGEGKVSSTYVDSSNNKYNAGSYSNWLNYGVRRDGEGQGVGNILSPPPLLASGAVDAIRSGSGHGQGQSGALGGHGQGQSGALGGHGQGHGVQSSVHPGGSGGYKTDDSHLTVPVQTYYEPFYGAPGPPVPLAEMHLMMTHPHEGYGHEPQPHHHEHHEHEEESSEQKEIEIEEKIFTKTIIGTTTLKKLFLVFVVGMFGIVIILGVVTVFGGTLTPIALPLALLPLGLVAFALFIPLLVIFVPFVVLGLAGKRKKRSLDGDVFNLRGLGVNQGGLGVNQGEKDLTDLFRDRFPYGVKDNFVASVLESKMEELIRHLQPSNL